MNKKNIKKGDRNLKKFSRKKIMAKNVFTK